MAKKKNVAIKQEEEIKDVELQNQPQVDDNIEADIDKMTPEQIEFAKIQYRKNFNERFSKWAEIEEEPADDEYIAVVKKDFDDLVEETKNKVYTIAEPENAIKSAELLKEWNATMNKWTKGSWRGIVMFNKVIDEKIESLKNDSELPLIINYSTLVFLYQTMMEPFGVGLEDALKMAKYENYDYETEGPIEEDAPVTFSGILEKVQNYVNELSAIDKKLNILRERYYTANAGLRTTLKISALEEFVEFANEMTAVNQGLQQGN